MNDTEPDLDLDVDAVADADVDLGASKGRALVTGASRGIGYELARLFAGTGFDVVLVARSEDELREHAEYFEDRFDVRADVVVADLSDPEAPEDIYETCQERGLEVTVLVNNAGFATQGPFVETDLETELDELQVNVTALTHLTKRFLPAMVDRRAGGVLNVASSAAFLPGPLMAVYYASKSYVLSFSEAIAEEVRDDRVSVTCLCPGPVDTGFQERAGVEDQTLVQLGTKDPRAVARAGYRGLLQGDVVVVPGLDMKAGYLLGRVAPRSTARKIAGLLNRN
jgi:short-subunit dehydrogenase